MNLIEDLKTRFDDFLESFPFSKQEPINLYAPISYILSLKGKRLRPILTMLTYQAVSGEDPWGAKKLASAIELFHNFTLMHDDIMDRAPVRRGKPTVHKVWNEDIAILSGDALFAYSMGLIVEEFPAYAAALAKEFSEVSLVVCEGQMEDMDLALEAKVGIPVYLEMIRKKTAALLGGCMSMGAIAGGASREIVEKCRSYAEYLGIGFQLQDDLMDAFPPEGFGKQVGGDIIENKKTYLTLKAMELADAKQLEDLNFLYGENKLSHEEKVDRVIAIFQALDIEEHTKNFADQYFEKARILGEELSEELTFGPIKTFMEFLANRKL